MAPLNLDDTHTRFAVVHAEGGGVPISIPLGDDGLALVTSLRLSLRFGLTERFIYVDEEVYDAHSRDLMYTIGQSLECDGDSKQWLLKPGRYRVYGVSELVMATSTELITPHRSSTDTVQLTLATRVKIEHAEELITILSDDSDGNSPAVAPRIASPLVNSSLPGSSHRSPINTVFVKMRQFHSLKIRTALNLVPFVSHYIETFQFIETFFHYNHFIPYTCENEISQFTRTPSIVLCLYSSL
jgi:hypothetical protein